ncbi:MAG: hypothetical protein ACNS62_09120 [Candidatus Cyclobacteriaceae bacterium M3_2C_046]
MKKLFIIIMVLAVYACDSKKPDEQAFLESLDSMSLAKPDISEEVISDIIQQIPSPLEISFLIKESGTGYNNHLLNSPKNTSNYNNNFKKALNLGIYGADLGYTNIYNQNQDAIFYLDAIRDLANGLSIGQFFDFGMIKKLATNSQNLDSLLLITTQNFNNINSYLQDQRRSNLSILLLSGGWLESLHIITQVALSNPDNPKLMEKIGEQKIILDNIKLLLDFYRDSDPNIEAFYNDLVKLDQIYSQIKINHTYAEPTFEEVNGMLVIKDNSTTSIDITEDNVKDIREITTSIRNKIII